MTLPTDPECKLLQDFRAVLVVVSVTRWIDYFSILGLEITQRLTEYCQIGEISPNLVTLVVVYSVNTDYPSPTVADIKIISDK